ncbi:MAG: zinc ribbon domain-containing protein [Clostridia bacterium]|nr:zinc ribbon domain-containing protein [Clostridia bacterium]
MKKCLKKILIIATAVVCACSIHITVSAQDENAPNNWGGIQDLIDDLIGKLPGASTTAKPDETTTVDSNTTTTDNIANIVTGVATTAPTTAYTTVPDNNNNNQGGNTNTPSPGQLTTIPLVTTEPSGEESASNGSLSDLLEQDSAAIIIQAPTETFTLNTGLVVNNGQREENFTWQQAALIAAAVLFVILAALVAALIVQRNKRVKEEEEERRRINNMASSSSSGPVPVEVMTPERIAELLGSAPNSNRGVYRNPSAAPAAFDISNLSGEESAAAIKAAILMSQLSQSYSDPLIRKYTEEPVMFSPVSKVNLEDGVTGAQILEATDSMLFDITGNEKYASDVSGIKVPDEDIESILNNTETKICPECQSPVASGDIFCHSCGAYVG